jgi:hypothetical protein
MSLLVRLIYRATAYGRCAAAMSTHEQANRQREIGGKIEITQGHCRSDTGVRTNMAPPVGHPIDFLYGQLPHLPQGPYKFRPWP